MWVLLKWGTNLVKILSLCLVCLISEKGFNLGEKRDDSGEKLL